VCSSDLPCAHNPTGVDPTQDEWRQILSFIKSKHLVPFFDTAYQGFATGDLDADAFAPRLFLQEGLNFFVTQSFAKNFGMYGERVGALHIVCSNTEERRKVGTQLNRLIRSLWSSPPLHGGRMVEMVLRDKELYAQWERDLQVMSERIRRMRKRLYDALVEKGTPGDWSHIVKQIGMFSYTGLKKEEVEKLITEWHVYLCDNGRISLSGLNEGNVEYMAEAIHAVVSESRK